MADAHLEGGEERGLGALFAEVVDEVARRHALGREVFHDVVGLPHKLLRVVFPELLIVLVEAEHWKQHV